MRFFAFVVLALALTGCVRAQGEWIVTAGTDFYYDNLDHIKKGVSTAGDVVHELGVPFVTRESHFLYAVRKHRRVEKSYLVFATAATQEVTVQAKVWLIEGVVAGVDVKKYDMLYPPKD